MIYGCTPFQGIDPMETFALILSFDFVFPDKDAAIVSSDKAKSFITALLNPQKALRLGSKDAEEV